jgi:hypothetical protein
MLKHTTASASGTLECEIADAEARRAPYRIVLEILDSPVDNDGLDQA